MANFLPLNTGLAAATTAVGGPKITVATFQVGESNAAVLPSQTGLQGALLYSGNVTQVYPVSDGTVNVVVQIPASAGPFNFGEIVLRLSDGTAFARMAYATVQEKISSTVSGLGATWTLNCLIKLGHLAATLNYTVKTTNEVMLVDSTGVSAPINFDTSTTKANLIIATMWTDEVSNYKSPILLKRLSDYLWDPEEFEYINSFQALSGTTTTVLVTNWFNSSVRAHYTGRTGPTILLQTADGKVVTGYVDTSTGNVNLSETALWMAPGVWVRMYYYESAKFPMIQNALLRSETLYEPRNNLGHFEVGLRGNPVRLYLGPQSLIEEAGNGMLWTSGVDVPLPNLPTTSAYGVSNLGWTTSVFNGRSDGQAIRVKCPAGGNFIILGRYQGAGNSGSSNDIEIAMRGKVTFIYAQGSNGSWVILVEGSGILGHNYGGDFIIGKTYLLPHDTAPVGFRDADGTLNPVTGFPEAFAVLGTKFNQPGDLVDYFRFPDVRGYHLRASDRGSGRDSGRLNNTFQQDAIKDHTHPLQVEGSSNDNSDPGPLVDTNFANMEPNGVQTLAGNSIAKSPAGAAVENRVKNFAQNAYIFVAR